MTPEAIADWAAAQTERVKTLTPDTLPDTEGQYSSLTRKQILAILKLKQLRPNATQTEIATFLGCSQTTVSAWLRDYRDSVLEAGDFLKAQALPAAVRTADLMDSKNDKVSLEASKAILQANKLLGNEEKQVAIGIQVVIGMPATTSNLPSHSSTQVLDTQAVSADEPSSHNGSLSDPV